MSATTVYHYREVQSMTIIISVSASLFLAVALCAAPSPTQEPEGKNVFAKSYTIRGVVVEQGSNQPLSGASVSLFKAPAPGAVMSASTFDSASAIGKIDTNEGGSFLFIVPVPGGYHLEVTKAGYGRFGPALRLSRSSTDVTVLTDRPTEELRFQLAMPGGISAAVFDAEGVKPIAGLHLTLWQTFFLNGQRRRIPAGVLTADEEGLVSTANVIPGDYLVEVKPTVKDERLMRKFSKQDLDTIDVDYADTFWPGGYDFDRVLPVPVNSRVQISLGRIPLVKVPYYRVHVSTPAGACESGEKVAFALQSDAAWLDELGAAECGTDVLLRGFLAGEYRLEAFIPSRSKDRRVRGLALFQITDKNIDLSVSLVRGEQVSGTILSPERAVKSALTNLKVSVQPVSGIPDSDELAVSPDTDGNFVLTNKQARDQRITLSGVEQSQYVKQIRYNGTELSDDVFTINPFAVTHNIEIVIDDMPARVTGTVTSRGHSCDQPYVVLVKWPLPSNIWPTVHVIGDGEGRFTISGLGAGDYRILAVSTTAAERFNEPNILAEMLRNARSINVSKGGSHFVDLDLSEIF
jgi:hypothetical protein